MMKDFYYAQYGAGAGDGIGLFYVGSGKVFGIDIGKHKYEGTYVERAGRLIVEGTLTAGPEGGHLVTGNVVSPGLVLDLTADWPANFVGQWLDVWVAGRQVKVQLSSVS
ncbi:MAG: hypothetical protein OXU70_09315 [Gammaproteobacteria bacterium]|nr:hypothetical protein [Gammaproteobacteria bacterium]